MNTFASYCASEEHAIASCHFHCDLKFSGAWYPGEAHARSSEEYNVGQCRDLGVFQVRVRPRSTCGETRLNNTTAQENMQN